MYSRSEYESNKPHYSSWKCCSFLFMMKNETRGWEVSSLRLNFNMENNALQGLRMNAAMFAMPAEFVAFRDPALSKYVHSGASTGLDLNNNFSSFSYCHVWLYATERLFLLNYSATCISLSKLFFILFRKLMISPWNYCLLMVLIWKWIILQNKSAHK